MRGGVGARYFLFEQFSSPFVGAAWMRSGGVDSAALDGKANQPHYSVNNIQWVNALAGYEIRRPDGLSLTLTTGWSFAITPEKDRYHQVSGTLSSNAKDWLEYSTGSGPIASFMIGYGF